MIGITRLVTGRRSLSDRYRYGNENAKPDEAACEDDVVDQAAAALPDPAPSRAPEHLFVDADGFHPVAVWNITQSCNLECAHCYYSAVLGRNPITIPFEDVIKVIDDLADARVPVLLLSGGEPMIRPDIYEIAAHARSRGINPVISTNGTLIRSLETAQRLKDNGVEYVGISIDGLAELHDRQRRKPGAFERTMRGIQFCKAAGLRVSMRFTVTAGNVDDLPAVLDLAEETGINRFCLYHLVPSGRGKRFGDIENDKRREIIEDLCAQAASRSFEILTVDNPADGPLVHQWAMKQGPEIAERVRSGLARQGGEGTGRRIVEIDHEGFLHPNQFWLSHTIGNVLEKPFGEIWNPADEADLDPLLAELRQEHWPLEGECGSCSYASICGGFRARALNVTGSLWGSEPSCTLTADERENGFSTARTEEAAPTLKS